MTTEQRFLQYVNKTPECWHWTGCHSHGYGRFQIWPKTVAAHHFSYELHYGYAPSGRILWTCGNTLCVNPDHLYTQTTEERFWKHVRKESDVGCWVWTGSPVSGGYGQFFLTVKEGLRQWVLAHRFSYTLAHGDIPKDIDVLHHCDNPPCVNPQHLFLGTQQDNTKDMVTKRRHVFGARHPRSKLTEKDILAIRSSTLTPAQLARAFGVHWMTIHCVLTRQTWKHVL